MAYTLWFFGTAKVLRQQQQDNKNQVKQLKYEIKLS